MKKVYSEHEKSSHIKLFCEMFYDGPDSVTKMIQVRFLNEDLKENFDDDIKGFFINAAQKLFHGKTDVDRITIEELKILFHKNDTLLKLQHQFSGEEFKINFRDVYSSKNLYSRFFKLFLETNKQKLKDFIYKRFKNENSEKNLNIDEQKMCFICAKEVINRTQESELITKKDIKKFKLLLKEAFQDVQDIQTIEEFIELQKTLEIDVLGDDDDSSSSEE